MLLRETVKRATRLQGGHYKQQCNSFASTSRAAQDTTTEIANDQVKSSPTKKVNQRREKISPLNFAIETFPSLMNEAHPVLDRYEIIHSPATETKPFASSVTFFNDTKLFTPKPPSASSLILSGGDSDGSDIDSSVYLSSITPFSQKEIVNLHQHLLKVKRVTQMTGKGKIAKMSALVIAGNGRGLVGYGEGKDSNAGKAAKKAFHEAVKTMDYVERYDGRTIPAEGKLKWGSTTVTLRPRPAGFGLRVPPAIHAIARCCGISDLSADIIGSKNPQNVVKAALQLLWGGSAPLGLGDGLGGSMRRKDKGVGIKTIRDMELARGRRLREVRL